MMCNKSPQISISNVTFVKYRLAYEILSHKSKPVIDYCICVEQLRLSRAFEYVKGIYSKIHYILWQEIDNMPQG